MFEIASVSGRNITLQKSNNLTPVKYGTHKTKEKKQYLLKWK